MLTAKYLNEHAEGAKTGSQSDYEAFGREVAELLLRSAAQSPSLRDSSSAEVVSEIATVRMQQNVAGVCVEIEICTPFGCLKKHIGI